jgi:hypothetical protein
MFEYVMRACNSLKYPSFLLKAALYVAAVRQHGIPAKKPGGPIAHHYFVIGTTVQRFAQKSASLSVCGRLGQLQQ